MLRLRNKLKLPVSLTALSLLLVMAGCSQDPIFDYVSGETAPTTARIQGIPSGMVGLTDAGGEKLYVSNGRIWEYDATDRDARWNRIAGPGDYVKSVASANNVLYALTIDNNDTTRVFKRNGTAWDLLKPHQDYHLVQNIFGAGDVLFATGSKKVGDDSDYAILYYDQVSGQFNSLGTTGNARLSGAGKVGNDYFLATRGKGVYKVPGPVPSILEIPNVINYVLDGSGNPVYDANGNPVYASIPADITGLLQAQDAQTQGIVIIGVSKDGRILSIDNTSGLRVDHVSIGGNAYTGALALIDTGGNPYDKLILLGYRGSANFQHGYMELEFDSSSGNHGAKWRIPGEAQPSSVNEYRQYNASLRRYPVTSLWVLPKQGQDPHNVVFAATSNQGLYSYRNRSDGGWQWNHEE